jgi:hypothetical protein
MTKCPYCRKPLREHEVYCDFCEEDTTKKIKKPKIEPKAEIKIPVKKPIKPKEPKIIAYCVKCRKKVIVKNPKDYTMKNKRAAIKGTCPVCSTKVFRIIGMKKK